MPPAVFAQCVEDREDDVPSPRKNRIEARSGELSRANVASLSATLTRSTVATVPADTADRRSDSSPESPSADAIHEATRAFRQIEAQLNHLLHQVVGGDHSESREAEAASISARLNALIASPAFLASMTCACGHDLSLHTRLDDLRPRCRKCISDRFGPDFDQLMFMSDLILPSTCGLVNKPE
jgi:hypothetical protein